MLKITYKNYCGFPLLRNKPSPSYLVSLFENESSGKNNWYENKFDLHEIEIEPVGGIHFQMTNYGYQEVKWQNLINVNVKWFRMKTRLNLEAKVTRQEVSYCGHLMLTQINIFLVLLISRYKGNLKVGNDVIILQPLSTLSL